MNKKLAFVALLFAISTNMYSAEDFERYFIKGKEVSQVLLKRLGGELKKNLKTNGLEKTIEFCSQNALAITYEVDQSFGKYISVKRVSTKNRNPANAPTKSEKKILFMLENSKDPILTKVSDGTFKYYQPLRISKPVCLKCHGKVEDIPEAARKIIHTLYPEDKATGYEFGDLRGAIVVTINPKAFEEKKIEKDSNSTEEKK
jgi:hypothetical protein